MTNLKKITTPFICNGDYCDLAYRRLIPKHLTPIIADLIQIRIPQVNQQVVSLEKSNIKESYLPLELSYNDFTNFT